MNLQRSVQIQVVLEGVSLPATRDELVRYAAAFDGAAAAELERLPDRRYESLDEVGEALAPTHPGAAEEALLPRAESGLPPGGDDYTTPFAESGAVRDDAPADNPPQKTIDKQSETLKRQADTQTAAQKS